MTTYKFGILLSHFEGGGAQRVVLNLAKEFKKYDVNFCIIVKEIKGPLYEEASNLGIDIHQIGAKNIIKQTLSLRKLCQKHKIETIFSVMRYQNVIAILLKIFGSKRVIIREANTLDGVVNSSNLKVNVLRLLMKYLYPYADIAIANSIDTKNDLVKYTNINSDKIKIIPNPIDVEEVRRKAELTNHCSSINLNDVNLITIGRLTEVKNHKFLIDSIRLLVDNYPNISLLIFGVGELKSELNNYIRKLNLDDNVKLMGFHTNPFNFLNKCDLFLLSSKYEGFGNVVVEALALGVPVISLKCPGGANKILENNKYGLVIDTDSPEEFASHINDYLTGKISKFDKEKLKERANEYSSAKIADIYLKTIFS